MKRLVVAALLLIAGLAVAYGSVVTGRENRYRDLIQGGDAAISTGDLSSAIEAFSGAIVLKPDSMVGYLKRGDAYRRRDDLEAAVRDLRQAAALDPGAPRPRELLGDVNYARNRFVPAVEHYQAYVDLDDSSPRVLYKLGLARYRAGQPAYAIDALKKAVAIDDRFAEAHYLLGLCQRDAQQTADALASLHRAVALAPAMLQAREELADLYARLGRPDDRIAQLEVLRGLDPTAARDVTLGLAYSKAGQSDRAVITLRDSAKRHPTHRYTFVALGRVWLEAAQPRSDGVDLGKALEALEHAITVEDSSEAYTLLGRALLLAFNYERAERMLLQAARKMPVDALAFYYLAEAAEHRAHFDVARQALLDYVAIHGEDPDARRRAAVAARVADLSMRVGDALSAAIWYERAAPVLSFDAAFVMRYAEASWRAGRANRARELLDRLLEKDPTDVMARALRRRMD